MIEPTKILLELPPPEIEKEDILFRENRAIETEEVVIVEIVKEEFNATEENRPLTFDQLREKILATTALPHLKNVWEKYKADRDMLSADEIKRLTAVKDAKKKELSCITEKKL